MPSLPMAQIISTNSAAGDSLLAFLVLLPLAYAIINIAFMLWLWPDARARGIHKPIGWMVAMLFLGPVALAFYLGMRPHGRLRQCRHCGEECLATEDTCPRCHASLDEQAPPSVIAKPRSSPLAHA